MGDVHQNISQQKILSYGRAVYRTSNIAERTSKSGKHEIKRLNRPSERKAPKRVSQGKRRREE